MKKIIYKILSCKKMKEEEATRTTREETIKINKQNVKKIENAKYSKK